MTAVSGRLSAYFYPRSPCGERLFSLNSCPWPHNFYPRSPCGERRDAAYNAPERDTISIHALLAESDERRGNRNDR